MTIGTMERVTPPPASMPASHAVSGGVVGVVGVAAALGAGVAGVVAFTANVVRLGTNGAASLFVGVGGLEP